MENKDSHKFWDELMDIGRKPFAEACEKLCKKVYEDGYKKGFNAGLDKGIVLYLKCIEQMEKQHDKTTGRQDT